MTSFEAPTGWGEAKLPIGRPTLPRDEQHQWEEEHRNQLVLQHLVLVKTVAARYRMALPTHVDVSDLTQAGVIGLIDAASKYKPGMGVSFGIYARHRIKGAIIDSLRELDSAPRRLRRVHKNLETAMEELTVRLQRHPTEAELAEYMKVKLDKLQSILLDLHNVDQIAGYSSPQSDRQPEWQSDRVCRPDIWSEENECLRAIRKAITRLPLSHRQVVHLHYLKETPIKAVGAILGVSESRVSQIHREGLTRLAKMLSQSGFGPKKRGTAARRIS